MAADQLAGSSAEALRSHSTSSDPVTQLLHLPPHRLFAECRFVEVRPSFDVAMPLRSNFFVVISAFIIGKAADIWRSRSTSARSASVRSGMHSRLFYGAWMRAIAIATTTARLFVAWSPA